MILDDEQWIVDNYGQLVWSVAIDANEAPIYNQPWQIYSPATDEFLALMKNVLLEFEALDPVSHSGQILRDYAISIVRKLEFRFHKDLRKRLRTLYPYDTPISISTCLGTVIERPL